MEARHAQIDHHIRSFSGLRLGADPAPHIGSVLSVIATMWRAEPAQKFFAEPSAPGILVRS
jgi:hypothetical protein